MNAPPLRSNGLATRWYQFWHTESNTLSFGIFRILFAVCLLKEIETTREKSTFAVEGGFHIPYISFIRPVPESLYDVMHDLQYPLVILLLLGLWMRQSCLMLILLQGYIFFADQLNFRNHPYFFLLVLVAILFSHADEALSFRSYLRFRFEAIPWRRAIMGVRRPATMQRLIQVQICLVYLFAAYHKCDAYFLNGHVLSAQAAKDMDVIGEFFSRFMAPERLDACLHTLVHAENLTWAARMSVALEIFIPLALWNRYTRPFAILLGLGFHSAIIATMNIKVFSWAVMGSYVLWLDLESFTGLRRSKCLRMGPSASSAIEPSHENT